MFNDGLRSEWIPTVPARVSPRANCQPVDRTIVNSYLFMIYF